MDQRMKNKELGATISVKESLRIWTTMYSV